MALFRRGLLVTAASVAASARGARAAEPPKPSTVVVNDSGGATGTWMRKAHFTEFERRYGICVVETSPVDFGKLRAMVESGNVEWAVTKIDGQDAIRAVGMGWFSQSTSRLSIDRLFPRRRRPRTSLCCRS
jgi:putative spermidine/putrescine transport system substrate-binding protein